MNRRIRKKKEKLAAMCASKYKYAKLGKKYAHAVYIQTRNCLWGIMPHKDYYASYLRRKRRCGKREHEITQHILSSKSLLRDCLSERKEVKEKLFVKEGNYNG
jgi:hypothetical protein